MPECDVTLTLNCGNVFADLGLPNPNVLLTEATARSMVGEDAKPTGKLRWDGRTGRLQHEWRGRFGAVFLDVPTENDDCGCELGVCRQNGNCPRLPGGRG